MMPAPVLIFAVGNESRGDDATGPLLLRRLDVWLKSGGSADYFEPIEDFQLQIEHAMDMKDRQLVLFIDAGMDTPSPFAFYRAHIDDEPVLYSHALSPEALLKVYTQFYGEVPPDAYVLCVSGASFELGTAPSLPAQTNLSAALEFAMQLLSKPDALLWDRLCTQKRVAIRSAQTSDQLSPDL